MRLVVKMFGLWLQGWGLNGKIEGNCSEDGTDLGSYVALDGGF